MSNWLVVLTFAFNVATWEQLDAAMQSAPTNLDTIFCLWVSVLVVIWVTWLEHLFNGPISGGNFGNCLISPPGVRLRQIQEARRHIITFSSILISQCFYNKDHQNTPERRMAILCNIKVNWVIHFGVWTSSDFISRLHECQYHKTRSSKRKLKCKHYKFPQFSLRKIRKFR